MRKINYASPNDGLENMHGKQIDHNQYEVKTASRKKYRK